MGVTLKVKNLEQLAAQFSTGLAARPTIRIQLLVQGPVAEYAVVWEWGRIGIKPGPKTQWGTNPDGDKRVMTITAPSGFIRIHRQDFRDIIREEIKDTLAGVRPSGIAKAVERGLRAAAPRIADIIADSAPEDTGALKEAIRTVVISTSTGATVDALSVRSRIRRRLKVK